MIAITTTLFVGNREELVWFDDLVWAETPQEAASLIRIGRAALLSLNNWQERGREVLSLLGIDADSIAWALSTAVRVNERPEDRWPDTLPPDF